MNTLLFIVVLALYGVCAISDLSGYRMHPAVVWFFGFFAGICFMCGI